MDIIFILLPLVFLMVMAYRGASVILFAPMAAMLGVLLYNPAWVPAFFSGIFMEKLAGFVRLYFPVFILGAIFGKLIELSGYARSITLFIIRWLGLKHSILWGPFARNLFDYIPIHEGRYYYARDHGPAHFIILDSGEDKPDSTNVYAGLNRLKEYREMEYEWFKNHLETNESVKNSPFRIVLMHDPRWGWVDDENDK